MTALAASKPTRHDLRALLAGMGADSIPAVEIAHVAVDSRRVEADTLFLAFAGSRAHGLDHVDQAVERGAAAVAWDHDIEPVLDVPGVHVPDLVARASHIAARMYDCPGDRLYVTGITGTDGKTSCAWLLAQALDHLDMPCGYLGTLGYGRLDDLAEATHTTPDPVATQDWLARFAAAGAEAVALEVSSHALDQHRVAGVPFDVAVLTQVGRDHLDYHGGEQSYAAAKKKLFEMDGLRYAVLNADDAHGRAWLDGLDSAVTPIVYGTGDVSVLAGDHVGLSAIRTRADGLSLDVDTHAGMATIESRLVGRFNATNLAAVLAVLLARGVSLERAVAVLGRIETVPGRMQRIHARTDQPLVVVDYAHTPSALEAALTAVSEHASARVLCVFGCGGDRDRGKRGLMGAAAARHADMIWLTDDNPRLETPETIVAEIRSGMPDNANVRVIHDRGAAIADAIASAVAGDVVLIAGKGHETTQQTGTTRRAFDDRTVARSALEAA